MTEENPQPAIEEIPFSEAVKLVGSKPGSSERKDLITYWGFGKKSWRWCIDTKMTLDEAIKTHQNIGDEIKMVVGKKGSIEKTREKEAKKRKAEMSKEEKQHKKEEKEQTRRREKEEEEKEKEEKKREKERKKEEERRLKEEKKNKGKKGEKESSENSTPEGSPPATTG